MKRPKVLASAYACHPAPRPEHYPGEAVLGWALVREMARFADVHVMTHTMNREGLEGFATAHDLGAIQFHFVELPRGLHRALRNRHYGSRFSYFLWQKKAGRIAARLHGDEGFDLFHQITFSNDWMPSFAGPALPIPFVWGPIGGGQRVPKEMMSVLGARERFRERSRIFLQSLWRMTPARTRCAEKASVILVCNKETKEKLEPWTGKVRDFPVNGISREDLSGSGPSNGAGTGFRILYAGRFDGIKGLPLALDAFASFHREHPEAILEFVGEGPEERRIRSLALRLGLGRAIRIVSWLSRPELFSRMRESDVFFFPSLRDGGGAVVIEAMASGLPVLCLDTGGPGFHVRPEWGIKVAPGNPPAVATAFAAALEDLAHDRARATGLKLEARRRVEEYYLWDRLGERLKGIYDEVLS